MKSVRSTTPRFGTGSFIGSLVALLALPVSACSDSIAEGDSNASVSTGSGSEGDGDSAGDGDGDAPGDGDGDLGGDGDAPGDSAGDGDGDSAGDGDGDGNSGGDGDGDGPGDGDGDSNGEGDGYYVAGNEIYDSNDQVHVFRGIDRPSLEWDPNGEGISEADIQLIASWNANVVRVAVNQGFWLDGSVAYAPGYRQRVDEVVQWSKAAGMDVILDLHWSDRGDLAQYPGQQRMADQNSRSFWQSVAELYRDDGQVLFELYNEPHDVEWSVWLEGGNSGDGFEVVGMQELYDTVRNTGAENLVLIGGLDYAYDLSGVPGHRVEGYNIVYTAHPYDFGNKQPGAWDTDWGFLAESDPIFVTEFGSFDCNPSYSQQLINYAEQRGLSWSAWAWYPGGCGFPGLIENWSGTPSATGQIVKTALEAN